MQKAQAFDTYYAYCGTWTYDATTETITHHLQFSLLPYETGREYRRHVSPRGDHLELSVSDPQKDGEVRTRTLAWQRVFGSATAH